MAVLREIRARLVLIQAATHVRRSPVGNQPEVSRMSAKALFETMMGKWSGTLVGNER